MKSAEVQIRRPSTKISSTKATLGTKKRDFQLTITDVDSTDSVALGGSRIGKESTSDHVTVTSATASAQFSEKVGLEKAARSHLEKSKILIDEIKSLKS